MSDPTQSVQPVLLPPAPNQWTIAGPALLIPLHPVSVLSGAARELPALSLLRVPGGRGVLLRAVEVWGACILHLPPDGPVLEPSSPSAVPVADPADAIAASTAPVAAAWLAADARLERTIIDLRQRLRRNRTGGLARGRFGQLEALTTRVEERIDRPPSLALAAGEVALHPVYLARVFRARYGCSLCTYQHRRRIDQAAASLAHRRHQNLAALASELGFADQSHFTRIFRRHVGVAPAAFARLLQGSWRLAQRPARLDATAIEANSSRTRSR